MALRLCFLISAIKAPQHDLTLFPGALHVDQSLVGGAAKQQRNILLRFYKPAVYQHIHHGQYGFSDFTAWITARSPQLFQREAGIGPYGFAGIQGLYAAEEGSSSR